MLATMLLVCTLACTNPVTGAAAPAGTVINRVIVDSSTQAGPAAFVPPPGAELKPDDGTPIGGSTTP